MVSKVSDGVDTVRTYTPTAKGQEFHSCPAKYRLILGAWGSGKTTQLIWEDIMLALEHPGSLGAIYRKTYPALRDTTKRDYLAQCPPELIVNEVKSEGREEIEFVNGSKSLFRCLDDFRKLGSTAFDRISVDEATEIGDEDFRTLAYGRLRGKIGPRRMMLAANPPNRDHWLYRTFVDEATDDTKVFHFSTYDNQANLPEGYIAKLEAMPELWKKKFLRGEWGILVKGTPVFGSFREGLHTAALRYMPGIPIARGWDFGFHHPACLESSHRVLTRDLRWRPAGELRVGDDLLAFDEFPDATGAGGRSRCWRSATVTAAAPALKPCLRVVLDDGTTLVSSTDHRFLVTVRSHADGRPWRNDWRLATELAVGDCLPRFFTPWSEPTTYEDGWVGGFYDGEGSLYVHDNAHLSLDVSQVRNGLLDYLVLCLARRGFTFSRYDQRELRPNQNDTERLHLKGGWPEQIRFLGSFRPRRLLAKYERLLHERGPHMHKELLARIVAIEPVGVRDVTVLETSTRTYIAEGYGHHNCVWVQALPTGHVQVLAELMGQEEDLYAFGRRVIDLSQKRWPTATFEDYVDAYMGPQRAANTKGGMSAIQVLRDEFKLLPRYRRYGVMESVTKIQSLLERIPAGRPLLQFDTSCRLLIDAFSGGYVFDPIGEGKDNEPKKDGYFDNVVDSLRYAIAPALMPQRSPFAGKPLPRTWRATASLGEAAPRHVQGVAGRVTLARSG